jgi:hypothetical protein
LHSAGGRSSRVSESVLLTPFVFVLPHVQASVVFK